MSQPASGRNARVIPVLAQADDDTLYAVRKRIYPRAVSGWFATWRWALVWITQAVFYGLCWLDWNGRQAVLFHLVERKFYIFGSVFWPQDVFFLTLILLISAFSLFLFTAVAGRLWCGYACPQTVYTEIFLWIEQKIEGDRPKRMKLDAEPMSARKLRIKATKQAAWIVLALWTGFTFVGYFTPIRELAHAVATWTLGPWETFWIFFYGFATYGNAGYMREQVCLYMCPYARFQGVMFDPDTLVITYDNERGDPRGARNKKLDYKAAGLGDCVDCGICVQVCPTGIDIRNGLQYECIGCAACIDACDQVMEKMSYPKGLIRYSTEHAIKEHWGRREIVAHLMRARTLIYTSILGVVVAGFLFGLTTRVPLRVDVIRDRASLAREVEDGKIENVFRLQLMNTAEESRRFALAVSGLDNIDLATERIVEVPPATTKSVIARVVVPGESASKGSHPIFFEVKAINHEDVFVREKASFLLP